MALSKTLKEKRLMIQCDSCFKNITLKTFIQCSECLWDLCVPCFIAGYESKVHRNSHSFRIVSNLTSTLLYDGWRAIDELLFIHGFAMFGAGNFQDIAFIMASKTEDDIKNHFYELFEVENSDKLETKKNVFQKSDPNTAVILSYMPKRNDFENEVINDYELLLESLDARDDDSEIEKKSKKYLSDAYRSVIKQRCLWKCWVVERGLTNIYDIKEHENQELSLILQKYKWLVKYVSKNDFNKFIFGIYKEHQLLGMHTKYRQEPNIDVARLTDFSRLLSKEENGFCEKINIPLHIYARIKRVSLECFSAQLDLRKILYRMLGASEKERIEILYQWFTIQNIVHKNEGSQ
ncbi:transcriptional adapter 2-alpha [Enteropsectra breve]|nr:transcriptional adapter 2-alpha [Enteropsectra breve]